MDENIRTISKDRIDTIDVLRGFALAGILYAHMVIWYTGAALPPEVYAKYDGTADGIAMGVFGALVFGKFFSVFSFLFGLGFYLHFIKNKSKAGYSMVYIWRLFLLFLIGIFHHVLWRGDILVIYAVLGVVLLLFRHLPHKLLLVMGLILIMNLPNHLYSAFNAEKPEAQVNFPMEEEAMEYYALVKNADFGTVLKENWYSWPAKIEYQLESGRLLMTFGYFLLGLYAGRINLFTAIGNNLNRFLRWNKFTKWGILLLLSIGLLMFLNDIVTIPSIGVDPQYMWLAGFLFSVYNACVAIFYISGITILLRRKIFKSMLKPLSAMGRMALTNYLLQTFFGLLFFYRFGFGLFDSVSPAINVLLAVGVFWLQLKLSQLWLSRFRQGPVEWLWRGLTYFRFSSIKK